LKNFVSVDDVSDLDSLIRSGCAFKSDPLLQQSLGSGKTAGLLFLNPSLRTRISTQLAATNLGMQTIVFNVDKEGWALEFEDGAIMNGTTVEHVKDAAPVLGRYFDILCIRTFPTLKNRDDDYSEKVLNAFINYAGVPVVSLESATLHPLQSLADLITIEEILEKETITRPKVVLTWAPHIKPLPQCVSNSFAQWMQAWNKAEFLIANPKGYDIAPEFAGNSTVIHNQQEALADADFIYVKNWSSYEQYGSMPEVEGDWLLTVDKLKTTNNARCMHCLPVRRNVELSDEILDSNSSLVTMQADNRVWAAQAVFAEILKNS
jgi:N-succinyl-L-ornithine transcarbamylase